MNNYDEKTLQYMTQIEADLGGLLGQNDDDSVVLEAMRYSLLGGGKRIRGILTLATCEMLCQTSEPAIYAASAMEMVHCYSLIHDDLPAMDDDDLRRGRPSCHVAYGEATAILAGDALLTLAFEALSRMTNAELAVSCIKVLAEAAGHKGMVFGQELDLESMNKSLTPAQLSRIEQYKTGALIVASMKMGALIGGASPQQILAIQDYASICGVVFQMIDDILDYTSSEEVLGKTVRSDSAQGKITAVNIYGIERSMQVATELTARAIAIITTHFDRPEFLVEFAKRMLSRKK